MELCGEKAPKQTKIEGFAHNLWFSNDCGNLAAVSFFPLTVLMESMAKKNAQRHAMANLRAKIRCVDDQRPR